MPIKLQKLPAAVRWGLAVLCAAVCGVLWAYYWRVFFGLDNRVSPPVSYTHLTLPTILRV